MTNGLRIRRDAETALSVALTPKQENFAQRFAAHGNASKAYREAFDCSGSTRPSTIAQRAYELVHSPGVASRVRELVAVAAEGTTIDTRSRMVRLQDIVEADPGELVRTVNEACRYCHGVNHLYQWTVDEFCAACDDAERTGKPLPTCEGGLGFTPHAEPHEECGHCHGDGVTRVVITPTEKLSPSARRLLKSIRQKATGEIVLTLHDQLAAADMLNKMAGVYVDRSVSLNVNANLPAPKDLTPEQALAYLDRLKPL
ncbi:MAG: terminase small subunit [Pseudomonadota bacterium]